MTTKFVQSPIPSCQLKGAKLITRILKQGKTAKDAHFVFSNVSFRLRKHPFRFRSLSSIKASKDNSADVYNQETELSDRSIPEMKAKLYQTLQGINRGIFGVQSAKKSEIESLVEQLESQNPTPYPTEHLQEVNGSWKLIYSTISILGVKRTKLGLREFITLGDFYQVIDVHEGKAVNIIKFGARGIMSLEGQLSIEASFEISSKTRVNIKYRNSTIIPKQLMNLFEKNYNLLLAIFNPDGWLEISYLDKSMRIGRDDKGNMFILERHKEESLKD